MKRGKNTGGCIIIPGTLLLPLLYRLFDPMVLVLDRRSSGIRGVCTAGPGSGWPVSVSVLESVEDEDDDDEIALIFGRV